MLVRFFSFCLVLAFFWSCTKEGLEIEDFDGTWKVDWIRCDNFHTKAVGQISFTINDSTNRTGIIQETIDSVTSEISFHFEFLSTKELLIDTLYDFDGVSDWLGLHAISEFQERSFFLERNTENCEGEKFKFIK